MVRKELRLMMAFVASQLVGVGGILATEIEFEGLHKLQRRHVTNDGTQSQSNNSNSNSNRNSDKPSSPRKIHSKSTGGKSSKSSNKQSYSTKASKMSRRHSKSSKSSSSKSSSSKPPRQEGYSSGSYQVPYAKRTNIPTWAPVVTPYPVYDIDIDFLPTYAQTTSLEPTEPPTMSATPTISPVPTSETTSPTSASTQRLGGGIDVCSRVDKMKCCRQRPPPSDSGLNPTQYCRKLSCDMRSCPPT